MTHTKEAVAFLAIDRGCRHGSPANFSIILSAIQSNTATNRLGQNDFSTKTFLLKFWLEFQKGNLEGNCCNFRTNFKRQVSNYKATHISQQRKT